jgi:exodeoxyribonuclease III
MKLVVWNCNMAFRNKADKLKQYRPDILIIPECESIDKLGVKINSINPENMLWFGANPNKGLGIFSSSGYKLLLQPWYNPEFKLIIPLSVSKGDVEFTLFAIWANNTNDKQNQYIEQVWKSINYYASYLKKSSVILAGDFNSNSIWDKIHPRGNHSDVVDFLGAHGIHSVYHKHFKLAHGKEIHPTFYLSRQKNKPYHIDYCFASSGLNNITDLSVGKYNEWVQFSDHMPLFVHFEEKRW